MVRGVYDPKLALPLIPVSDGVGEIEALGEDVQGLAIGDRVCPMFAQGWIDGPPVRATLRSTLGGPLPGTLAEKIVVRADSVARVPKHLSDAEAATLPCAGLTAWSALVGHGPLERRQTLLVLGTGGVASFAIQFAAQLGATVIVTSRSSEKLLRAKALGANHVIDTTNEPAWSARARELSGGEGVDHVLEVSGTSLGESLRAVRPGGTISLIGVLGGAETNVNLNQILMRDVRVQGIFVGNRKGFEAMTQSIGETGLRPAVDSTFSFGAVPEAFEKLQSATHVGKIVITH
jgi:NADPH:quinone reductase-like Zn-dependent oxidoreductase